MEHPARKITKIAREAEHLVLLALRGDGVGTAEIDCIHAVRHHPGVTQAELTETLNSDKAAIARRTASRAQRIPAARTQSQGWAQPAALSDGEGGGTARCKGRSGERFLRLPDGRIERCTKGSVL